MEKTKKKLGYAIFRLDLRKQAVRNGTDGFVSTNHIHWRVLVLAVVCEGSQLRPKVFNIYVPLKCTGFQGGVTQIIVF
jgi:hypothetical protein